MKRDELKKIIGEAADEAKCSAEERARLVATADETDMVAVGTWYLDLSYLTEHEDKDVKCGCPATIAGYHIDSDGLDEDTEWSSDSTPQVRAFPREFDSLFNIAERDGHVRGPAACWNEGYVEIED